MAIDKIFKSSNVDDLADNILSEVDDFMVSVKQMQQRKASENVQTVIHALKKIETNIQDKYDNVTDVLEKRVSTIKDGRDGVNGTDGRSGRDGKPGRDGVNGKQGTPGTPGKDGVDGVDGVSVTNANIDFDGSLVISLSSGEQINVGEVVPPELERQLVELRQGGGSAGSSGDVMGPTASTDNAIVRFDGTTGKVVQNSEVTIDDTGNTNFAQTPVLYSGDGTVESGRLLGRYSYRTATPTTAYFYDFNNSNTITSADSLSATKLATLIDSTITNANALTAFGTSYGAKNAGVSFVSGTASDILLASVGSAPLLNADINAVVVGYTSVGPRIAIQNYALNDDTANAISYVGAVHRFYPAGTEVAKISSTGLDVTGAATVSTTLGVTGVSTLTAGAVIQGLTVGLGAGAVATNTAVGASAFAANVSGANNTAVGNNALAASTGSNNNALGRNALATNSSGSQNVAVGGGALFTNLASSNSTAIGHNAGNVSTGAGNQFFGYNSGNAVTTGAKNVILGSYTGSAAPISATGSNNIVLSDGDGVVRQVIDSSGNVGIGTSSPGAKLDVSAVTGAIIRMTSSADGSGAGVTIGDLQFYGNDASVPGAGVKASISAVTNNVLGDDADLIFKNSDGTTNNIERMRIDFSGNVGIGTSSPDANLTVNGAASFAAGTALLPSITRAGDLNTGMWFPAADTIAFSEGGAEAMRIDSSGNVGIGNTSITDFSGRILAINASSGAARIKLTTATSGTTSGDGGGITYDTSNALALINRESDGVITFLLQAVERIRIDNVGNMQMQNGAVMPYAPAPAAISAAATLSNANIQGQIISATGTTYTITMPTGTTMETLATWAAVNVAYDFYVINTATGVITMAVNTDVTSLGSLTIAIGASAHFRIRRTAASTFVLYRLV